MWWWRKRVTKYERRAYSLQWFDMPVEAILDEYDAVKASGRDKWKLKCLKTGVGAATARILAYEAVLVKYGAADIDCSMLEDTDVFTLLARCRRKGLYRQTWIVVTKDGVKVNRITVA